MGKRTSATAFMDSMTRRRRSLATIWIPSSAASLPTTRSGLNKNFVTDVAGGISRNDVY
jgi:hypothetical protein